MLSSTPSCSRIYTTAVLVASGALPIAGLTMWAWGTKLYKHPAIGMRPQLVLMVFMAVLLIGTSAFCVAVLAKLHASIGEAFAQGYKIAHAELQLGFTPSDLAALSDGSATSSPALRAVK